MKLWLIAKSNIKNKKGNAFILFFLVLLASMLLYTGITVLKNMNCFLDENYESQNGAHYMAVTNTGYDDKMVSILKGTMGYQEHEIEDALCSPSTGDLKKEGSSEKADTISFVFQKMDYERNISDFIIQDKGEECKKNSIALPMYLKVAKGFQTGDKISIAMDGEKFVFEIYGFVEDVMFATPSNISCYRCYVTDEMYQEMIDTDRALVQSRIYNVKLKDMTTSGQYETAIMKEVTEQSDSGLIMFWDVNYMTMRTGAGMMMNILMSILAVFSVLIVLIAIVVMRFSVVSNMEENMSNIGILEALGYTSRQLAHATILEYIVITVVGIICGLLTAGLSADLIAGIVSGSIGMRWKTETDVVAAIVSIAVVLFLILAAVTMTSRRYKKITTLDALRDGIETHSFKRNHLPLQKSCFGLNTSLGLKTMLHNKKQNVAMVIIVTLLSYASVLMLMLYYNFVFDNQALINLVGIEKPNVQFIVAEDKMEQIEEDVLSDDQVDRAAKVGYLSITIQNKDKETTVSTDIWTDIEKMGMNTLQEGRYPKEDNEVCVTNVVADTIGAELGNSVCLKYGEVEKSFLIVGITQQISNMGKRMTITEEAAKTLLAEYAPNILCVYLKDGADTKQKVDKWSNLYNDMEGVQIDNFDEAYDSILGTFTGAIAALCIVMVAITIAVVGLTVFLLVRMKMIRERKALGVYKAIGYTTPQLMKQVLISFVPVVGIGVILGGVLAAFSTNAAFALALGVCGIENCHMRISAALIVVTALILTFLAFLVVFFASMRIRKIEPYKMITE